MEKRLKRIEIAVMVLIVLTLFSIVSPHITSSKSSKTTEIDESKELPEDITRDYLDKTIFKIKNTFNEEDWVGFYGVFGEYARAQIDLEKVESEFKKLRKAVGSIGTYNYSHHIYEGNGNGADWFEVYYKCRFENGKGTIKVSTRTIDGKSEIVGINIVLDAL